MRRSVATAALSVSLVALALITPATARAHAAQSAPVASLPDETPIERPATVARSMRAAATSEQAPAPAALVAAPPPVASPEPVVVPSVADARVFALAEIGATQFACLDTLWQHESDWDAGARNPSSGAYGIPQALPAAQMASVGDDWPSNPITQVRWGLSYIAARYGSACNAWSFWLSRYPHWY